MSDQHSPTPDWMLGDTIPAGVDVPAMTPVEILDFMRLHVTDPTRPLQAVLAVGVNCGRRWADYRRSDGFNFTAMRYRFKPKPPEHAVCYRNLFRRPDGSTFWGDMAHKTAESAENGLVSAGYKRVRTAVKFIEAPAE